MINQFIAYVADYQQLAKSDKKRLGPLVEAVMAAFSRHGDLSSCIAEEQQILLAPCLVALTSRGPKLLFRGLSLVSKLIATQLISEPHIGTVAQRLFELSRAPECLDDDKVRLLLIKTAMTVLAASPTLDESGVSLSTAMSALVNLKLAQDRAMRHGPAPPRHGSIVSDAANTFLQETELLSQQSDGRRHLATHCSLLVCDLVAMARCDGTAWLRCSALAPDDAVDTVIDILDAHLTLVFGHPDLRPARRAVIGLCEQLIAQMGSGRARLLSCLTDFNALRAVHASALARGWTTAPETAYILGPLLELLHSPDAAVQTHVLPLVLHQLPADLGDTVSAVLGHCLSLVSTGVSGQLTQRVVAAIVTAGLTAFTVEQLSLAVAVTALSLPTVPLTDALSAVERLWSLADRATELGDRRPGSPVTGLIRTLHGHMASVCIDPRDNVRLSAIKTLFAVLRSHVDVVDPDTAATLIDGALELGQTITDKIGQASASRIESVDYVDASQESELAAWTASLGTYLSCLAGAGVGVDPGRVARLFGAAYSPATGPLGPVADKLLGPPVLLALTSHLAQSGWGYWGDFIETCTVGAMAPGVMQAFVADFMACPTAEDIPTVVTGLGACLKSVGDNAVPFITAVLPRLTEKGYTAYLAALPPHERARVARTSPVHFIEHRRAPLLRDMMPWAERLPAPTAAALCGAVADLAPVWSPGDVARLHSIMADLPLSVLAAPPHLSVLRATLPRTNDRTLVRRVAAITGERLTVDRVLGTLLGLEMSDEDRAAAGQGLALLDALAGCGVGDVEAIAGAALTKVRKSVIEAGDLGGVGVVGWLAEAVGVGAEKEEETGLW